MRTKKTSYLPVGSGIKLNVKREDVIDYRKEIIGNVEYNVVEYYYDKSLLDKICNLLK